MQEPRYLNDRSPSTRPFMPGLHQPVGVAVVHLTNGFPGSFCQALGAALPGPRWGGRGLEGARSTGFLRTPGTSTGPFHPHCPLHFSGGPNVSRCTKCCLYYFVRNDFSVNQALMKISATKIKFYILREAILGDFPWLDICWRSQAAGCRPVLLAFPRLPLKEMQWNPRPTLSFQLVPTAVPVSKVCFLEHWSGGCCGPASRLWAL